MKVSVVIPTLNEAQHISNAIANAWSCGASEVIIVDGGSDDETARIAQSCDCNFLQSHLGRGVQLNRGANESSGEILLFLHADSSLPVGSCHEIAKCIAQGNQCGAFRQKIEAAGAIYRILEFGNELRVRWLNMAYGDQGIFVTREIFEQLGGFEEIPVMEDFCFSRQLKRHHRYTMLPGPIRVSARRWQTNGPIQQTFRNWTTIFRFLSGVDPTDLKYGRE